MCVVPHQVRLLGTSLVRSDIAVLLHECGFSVDVAKTMQNVERIRADSITTYLCDSHQVAAHKFS